MEASEDDGKLVRCDHVASHLWQGTPPHSQSSAAVANRW